MEGAMRTISVRLDDGSEARLDSLCHVLGLSQSEVVKAGSPGGELRPGR